MALTEEEASRVTICYGPAMEERLRDPMGVRWCFKCRKRAEFVWVVLTPIINLDDPDSLYAAFWGPSAHSECGNCKQHDGQLFPGWSYRWADE